MIDTKATRAFLSVLGGDSFVFQTFTDNRGKKNKRDLLARVYEGSFDEHEDILCALSEQGAGIFIQINKGEGRGKKYIDGVRALFVDLDNPTSALESLQSIQKHMPKPSITVQSSKGKYHLYWVMKDCTLEQFPNAQQSLAITFNTDPAVKNLDRVMRLPGFPHQKRESQPVKLVMTSEHVYNYKEIRSSARSAPVLTSASSDLDNREQPANAFGLGPVGSHISATEFKTGARVNTAVKEIGYLISQGFNAEEVRKRIEAININSKLPISDNRLQREVFPCIDKWALKQEQAKLKAHSETSGYEV